jgi:hypothetical protein
LSCHYLIVYCKSESSVQLSSIHCNCDQLFLFNPLLSIRQNRAEQSRTEQRTEDSHISLSLLLASFLSRHKSSTMFQRIDNIPIEGSPSFQSNNLSSVGDFLCYVHLNEVSILDDQRFMKITPPKSLIYEVKEERKSNVLHFISNLYVN